MPAVQYPFIDIAVHPRIRERFARGEAMALFSVGLDRVLWANGAGADLFGYSAIYDFIEQGAKQGDVSFRQIASTARQLAAVGDTRSFLIRIAAGFQRVVVNAAVEMVSVQAGEQAILFSCPVSAKALDTADRAKRMLEGFDDPDTHMAVLGRDGEVVASSAGFKALGITPQTASMLVTMAGSQPERLIKRPIPTGQGYLPAAIGRLSEDPALHLLFVVEMVIGHLDPVDHAAPAAIAEPVAVATEAPAMQQPAEWAAEDISTIHPAEAAIHDPQPEMLGAIPAVSLPQEASAPAADAELFQHVSDAAPHPVEPVWGETLSAIPAAFVPAEPVVAEEPVLSDGAEEAHAGDVHGSFADFHDPVPEELTELASVDESHLDWATSDIPPVASSEIAGLMDAVEQAPEATAHQHGHVTEGEQDFAANAAASHEEGLHQPFTTDLQRSDFVSNAAYEGGAIVAHQAIAEGADDPVPSAEHLSTEDNHATAAEDVHTHPENPAFAAVIEAVRDIEDVEDAPEDNDDGAERTSGTMDPGAATDHAAFAVGLTEASGQVEPNEESLPATEAELPAKEHAENRTEQPFAEAVSAEPSVAPTTETFIPSADATWAPHAREETPVTVEQHPSENEPAGEDVEVPVGSHVADQSFDELTAASLEDAAPASPADVLKADHSTPAIAEAAPAANEPPAPFAFNRHGRATRFVWKIDAEGRFSEISREFAEAVGPHATSVIGVAFTDIAALFNLDPDGKIAELLARRDTWSGRTIHWPVEGTTLTVPVDLAALPTYTRSREFDGFRGFGVVRLSDAAEDPQKVGLTLTGNAAATATEETAAHEIADIPSIADAPAPVSGNEADAKGAAAEEVAAPAEEAPPTASAEEPELPFHSEPPALRIVETPARRLSDKIIQLHEHRLALNGDTLSPSEQAAFREIGKQLQPFGKRAEPPHEEVEQAEVPAQADAAEHGDAADFETAEDAVHPAANDAGDDSHVASSADTAPKAEDEFDPLAVLNTAIPPRSKMIEGLSADMVDQLPVAILIHAGDTLMHANPEFLRLTGYASLTEVEGVGGLDALLQRHDLQGKTERPGTMVVVRADDTLVPVTARLQSIRWEESSALMLALMPVEKEDDAIEPAAAGTEARDEVRPERMIEKVAKLQVEVEELRSILETATDGVAIIGPEGDIRSMNRSASALFNYDEQETRGKPFIMLFAHESQKAVLDYLNGLSGNGVASLLNDGREVIGREASGGFVPLFMTMGALTSSNGYCAVIRDITQWKRTEEELRNAKRAAETANAHKTDFLARVSHEIRTPLNAIVGFSDMMASERLGPIGHPRYVEYAGDIGRSGRHVLDIVNDLLDISKIEAGEMDLEFGSVGLNAAIAEAVSIVQPQANGQRVIIRTALSQAVPDVVADLRSIKQIVLNILANAIRFTPSGGQIVVSTSYEANGSVVMRIRDTGVGMTRTELEQAMKPFRQVTTNTRQRGDGTGLGLPLTKAMVDANRAVFAIHSAPNEGTLVEITFPSPRVLAN